MFRKTAHCNFCNTPMPDNKHGIAVAFNRLTKQKEVDRLFQRVFESATEYDVHICRVCLSPLAEFLETYSK